MDGGSSDGYNLGHYLMDYMDKCPEDCIWQIDAATGEKETTSSVKSRSIQLARCLRRAGLQPGDVVVVSGRNHLDVHIPFYASYLTGLPLAGVDPIYKYEEIKKHFETTKPKIVFCELDSYDRMYRAAKHLGLDTKVVTFGEGEKSLANFIQIYEDHEPDNLFKVATFDMDKVFAWLVSTSGTSGLPKVAAFKHSSIIRKLRMHEMFKKKEIRPTLNLSSVQWISSYLASLSMTTGNHIKVQSSAPVTVDHAIDIINNYRPVSCTASPNFITSVIRHSAPPCDLSSFETIVITGSAIGRDTLQQLKSRMRPEAVVWNIFAQTECVGPILMPAPEGPVGNVGKEFAAVQIQDSLSRVGPTFLPCRNGTAGNEGREMDEVQVQLVDYKTGQVIKEPNKTGELWFKGPRFSEYYNNPEATANAFTPDGWYKTGDLLYRDENGYYFHVDRMSSAFKVRRYFVMPMEVENVIQTHPDVVDVCVVGVPHAEDGKRAAAVVQRRVGAAVIEKDIKDLVASKLSDQKHLHGGVIFVDNFPRTVSGKIVRAKVQDIVLRQHNNYLVCNGGGS